jgi:protocatechuate 3,4-dioxygenase beta subunit
MKQPLEEHLEMMKRTTSDELDRRTIADIHAVMNNKAGQSAGILEVIMRLMRNGFVQGGMAAAVVAVVVGAVLMSGTAPDNSGGTTAVGTNDASRTAELAKVEKLYEMKDAKALADAMPTVGYDARIAAANYLATIGDSNSIDALEKAASQWKGQAGENPFTRAVEAIKVRVKAGTSAPVATDVTTPAGAESVGLAPKTPSPTREGKSISDAESRMLTIKVIDATTGLPMAEAQVGGDDDKGTTRAITGADGTAELRVLAKTKYMRVVAKHAGCVGQMACWTDEAALSIPAQQTYRLDKAITIGGVVQTPENKPLEGVSVEVHKYIGNDERDDGTARQYLRDTQITDRDGRWRCDMMPADMSNTGISFLHKEYQESGWSDNEMPEPELRALKAVMTLQPGHRLYGIVTNSEGQPLKGARVQLGEYGGEAVRTGEDGRFDIRSIKEEAQIVTVQAKQYAPLLRVVQVPELAVEQVFVLDKGQVLSGKVVDTNGTPIPEATVYVEKWQGYKSLRKNMKTLKDGTFGWKNAPAGALELSIMAKGYRETIATGIVADGQEKVIVLSEQVRVKGRVTDAATGEPVSDFEFQPGFAWPDSGRTISFQPMSSWAKKFTNGDYSYAFERAANCYGVRIVAKGYLPAESRVIEPNERLAICDIALQRSGGVKGIVRLPDGKPAAGVSVYIFSQDEHPYLNNGKLGNGSGRPSTKTAADGTFSLPEPAQEYKVGVTATEGLALVTSKDLQQSGEVKLVPWGVVEGQYYSGSKPAAGRKISLVYQGDDWSASHTGQTDEQGHFVFMTVRPGVSSIDGHAVDVLAGQTTTVVIGGAGRTVRMELVLPDELSGALSEKAFSLYVTPQQDEEALLRLLPVPASIDSMTMAQVAEWYRNYTNSDEGKRFIKEHLSQAAPGRLYMPVNIEGRVAVVEDVPAGLYTLAGRIYASKADGAPDYQKPVTSVYHEFEVPAIQDGQLDVPLDLGKVDVGRKPRVGAAAPNFEMEGADGHKMQLSDYAGKVVLVVMCISQGGAEDPEVTSLKKLYETHSGDSRFAMIGIVPEPRSHPVIRVMMREMALPWPVGYTGAQKATMILRDYGASDVGSWNVLVSADGKILATDLKADELVQKVEEALAKSAEVGK